MEEEEEEDEEEEEEEEEEKGATLVGMSTLRPAWIVLLQKCLTAVAIHFPLDSLQRKKRESVSSRA